MTEKPKENVLLSDKEFHEKYQASIPAEVKKLMRRLAEEDGEEAAAALMNPFRRPAGSAQSALPTVSPHRKARVLWSVLRGSRS